MMQQTSFTCATVVVLLGVVSIGHGFTTPTIISQQAPILKQQQQQQEQQITRLGMGLYDDPLPPPPNFGKNNNNNDNENSNKEEEDDRDRDEDFISDDDIPRLFSMTDKGVEENNLLPPLERRSRNADIGCYYQPQDQLVVGLVLDTECHWEDAAWALEAHNGDFASAKLDIERAQTRRLELKVLLPDRQEIARVDWDAELFELINNKDKKDIPRPLGTDGREQRKQNRIDEDKKNGFDFFGGKPDQDWLPKKPPQPYDDEPWFTG